MLWAEPAGYQLRHAARQRPHPSTRGLARPVILKWPGSAAWGPLSPHARYTPASPKTQKHVPLPQRPSSATGHKCPRRVRGEMDVRVLGSSLEDSRLLGGTRSAAWGSWSRWSHVHALGGRAASEEQRPTCLPHPRPACVRRLCLVLAVRCGTLAVGARGRWAVVNRSPPAHSKWLPRPTRFRRAVAMGYQGGCHGLPDRGSGSVRGMAGACGLLSRGPRGWGLSYKEGPGKRRDSTRDATQSLPALAASTLLFRLKQSGFCGNFCSLVFFSPSFLLYLLKRSLWILKEKGHELAESVQLK